MLADLLLLQFCCRLTNFIYLFNFAYKGRVTTTAYANYCGPALPNPPCQLSLWEEILDEENYKILDEENDTTETAPIVKWQKFEYVVIGVNADNSEKKKLKLVDKSTTPGEMFSCLKNLLQTYPTHQFRAN